MPYFFSNTNVFDNGSLSLKPLESGGDYSNVGPATTAFRAGASTLLNARRLVVDDGIVSFQNGTGFQKPYFYLPHRPKWYNQEYHRGANTWTDYTLSAGMLIYSEDNVITVGPRPIANSEDSRDWYDPPGNGSTSRDDQFSFYAPWDYDRGGSITINQGANVDVIDASGNYMAFGDGTNEFAMIIQRKYYDLARDVGLTSGLLKHKVLEMPANDHAGANGTTYFGRSVAVGSNRVAVSAPGYIPDVSTSTDTNRTGIVFVYDTTGMLRWARIADDTTDVGSGAADADQQLGYGRRSLAVGSDRVAAATADKKVYVWDSDGNDVFKITAAGVESDFANTTVSNEFAKQVLIYGRSIIISDPECDNDNADNTVTGAIFIYDIDGGPVVKINENDRGMFGYEIGAGGGQLFSLTYRGQPALNETYDLVYEYKLPDNSDNYWEKVAARGVF